ncbi:endonuclease 8-like 1 [Egretta garzetta]|uniref:endonuclease 8-like 1 n=1 Tax=Egretta garzetta TaxID=188379 RepID=UPI00163C0CF7|nr:endonuclease 8-like 1 [Egretta garzetta]
MARGIAGQDAACPNGERGQPGAAFPALLPTPAGPPAASGAAGVRAASHHPATYCLARGKAHTHPPRLYFGCFPCPAGPALCPVFCCRENVLKNLDDKAFDKPICEALLNQKFFNGIGNYLRAEILYRLKIPPFEKARTVLEALKDQEQARRKKNPSLTLSKKLKLMRDNPDLLELCHTVPMEVIATEKNLFDPDHSDNYAAFKNWLQCYLVPGMNSLRDRNGRTIWFQGEPGPMAPKGQTSRKKHTQLKADPKALTPEVTTRASKRHPRAAAKSLKSKTAKEEELADGPRKGRARGRRKTTSAPALSEPEVPVKAKRSHQMSTRRSRGAAPAV